MSRQHTICAEVTRLTVLLTIASAAWTTPGRHAIGVGVAWIGQLIGQTLAAALAHALSG